MTTFKVTITCNNVNFLVLLGNNNLPVGEISI